MNRPLAIAAVALSLGCSNSDPHASPAGQEGRTTPSVLPDKPAPAPADAPGAAVTAPSPSPSPSPSSAAAAPSGRQAEQAPAAKATSPLAPASAVAEPPPGAAPSVAVSISAVAAAPPTASAGGEDVKGVMSSKTTESSFNLWMQSAGKYKAGQPGAVQVVLVAKGAFHCNDKYPYKFKLGAPSAGVSYPQPVVRAEAMSITPDRGVMSVPVLPSAPGEARVGGTFSFSVCSAATCQVESRELSLNIKIE